MLKAFFTLAAAASVVVASQDVVSVKGYTADVKSEDDCKFGYDDILGGCGTCTLSITQCAASNPSNTASVCIKHLDSVAKDCGGCSVTVFQSL